MITIALMGGLGNQLFEYALGRAIEFRGERVQYDTSLLDNDRGRKYMLNQLGLINHRLTSGAESLYGARLDEGSMRFRPQILELKGNHYLRGFWQSEKYFENIAGVLRREMPALHNLSLKGLLVEKQIKAAGERSCFIHVRRSDNLRADGLAVHGLTSAEESHYYYRAISIMAVKVPDVKFFAFSDEPKWLHQMWGHCARITIVDHNPPSFTVTASHDLIRHDEGREVEDLYLMSLCHNAIIANSTFSWWGAWLNQHEDERPYPRVVIAPEPWFATDQLDATDIIPNRWIRTEQK